jgi:hypothetical protein
MPFSEVKSLGKLKAVVLNDRNKVDVERNKLRLYTVIDAEASALAGLEVFMNQVIEDLVTLGYNTPHLTRQGNKFLSVMMAAIIERDGESNAPDFDQVNALCCRLFGPCGKVRIGHLVDAQREARHRV